MCRVVCHGGNMHLNHVLFLQFYILYLCFGSKTSVTFRCTFFFLLNNQPDALIIPILFCYKTLHVSGIFSARHQEFSTVHSALISFMQVSDDRFQAESGWNSFKRETYQCRMDSRKLLMMGREDAQNMYSFITG
jgi:hypothetical protein